MLQPDLVAGDFSLSHRNTQNQTDFELLSQQIIQDKTQDHTREKEVKNKRKVRKKQKTNGGEGGIRTLDRATNSILP